MVTAGETTAVAFELAVGEDGATTNALVICGQQGGTGALVATGAETLTIVGGMAYVGVSVRTNADLTAETKSWGKVNVRPGDVSVENGAVIIAVPANAEKGFMVLESGD